MKPTSKSPSHPFLESLLLRYSPNEIPLDLGACALAQPHSPGLDPELVVRRLDGFAKEAMGLVRNSDDPDSRLEAVREVLFGKCGFTGNSQDYYSPDNSLIDRVLESRRGIPITLSVLFIETARRVGVELEGCGLPCHFVVGRRSAGRLRLFDPFDRGEEKSLDECIGLVHLLSGGSVSIGRADFVPTSSRNILLRMLMNLRGIYRNRGEGNSLIAVLEQLLMIGGQEASIHGELALHLAETGRLSEARLHLESYTELARQVGGETPSPVWLNQIRARFSPYN